MSMTRWASLTGSLFVFLVLGACGGGGDGGGNTVVPPPQQPVLAYASDYWQASTGSLWLYEGRDATTNNYYRTGTSLGATMAFDGRTLTRFEYTNSLNEGPSPQYRAFGAEGIRTYLEVVPSSASASYLELPADIRVGTYRAYDSGPLVLQGGTMSVTIDVAIKGFESLSVPGGKFANALRTTHIVSATITTNAGSSTGQSTIDYWYAKGIGIVKQVLTDPNYPAGSNTYSEELAGVVTAGIRAGVVGELALLQNLNGGSSETTTGRPGIASDGSGYLVVAYKTVNYRPNLVATYVLPDGTTRFAERVIAEFPDSGLMSQSTTYGPVRIAWDGARFWVVAEGAFYGLEGGVVRQRVLPDGTVMDGPTGAVLSSDGRQAALAIEGNTALVTYASYQAAPPDWKLYADAYALDGTPIATRVLLDSTGLNAGVPSVTGHAGEFLVTYEAGSPADVRAVRISLAGVPLDTTPISVASAAQSEWNAETAGWGGDTFVTVWQDSASPSASRILAARMSPTGAVLDSGIALCTQSTERHGTAAADGAPGTLLGWTVGSFYTPGQASGIYGRAYAQGADLASGTTLRLGMLNPQDHSTRLMHPAAAASAEGFMVVWTYNTESAGASKSVRGVLVYPRYGT